MTLGWFGATIPSLSWDFWRCDACAQFLLSNCTYGQRLVGRLCLRLAAHRRVVVTWALLIALVGVVLIIVFQDREQRPRSSAVPNSPSFKKQSPRKLRIRGPVMVGIPWGG